MLYPGNHLIGKKRTTNIKFRENGNVSGTIKNMLLKEMIVYRI